MRTTARMKVGIFLVIILGLFIANRPFARAEDAFTVYLPITHKPTTCTVPTLVYPTIQSAIDGRCAIINLTASLYIENIVIQDHIVAINGLGPENTTLNGNNAAPVIVVEDNAEMTLDGVTVMNGRSNLMGGGIRNRGVTHITGAVIKNNTVAGNGPGGGIASDGTLTVKDSWIMDNTASTLGGAGGGLYLAGYSTAHIENTVISGNEAHYSGGGVFIEGHMADSQVTILNSQLLDNEARHGGGIGMNSDELLVISGVTFANNVAGDSGGGLYNYGPTEIYDSEFIANSAGYAPVAYTCGGAIFTESIDNISLLVERTEIRSNFSVYGGGICYQEDGPLEIYESLFVSNSADEEGGAIYGFSNTVPIAENSTFVNNTAGMKGGAFSVTKFNLVNVTMSQNEAPEGRAIFSKGQFQIVNSIVSGAPAGDLCDTADFGDVISLGHNLATDNSCNLTAPGDMPNTNPLLGPLQDNGGPTHTLALLPGSPAINNADNTACPPTDQRGVPRPQGPACDIGAYEYDG